MAQRFHYVIKSLRNSTLTKNSVNDNFWNVQIHGTLLNDSILFHFDFILACYQFKVSFFINIFFFIFILATGNIFILIW